MNRHPLRLLARSATFALTLAILAACGTKTQQQDAMPPAQVSVAPVIVKDVTVTDDFTGRIAAVETVELRPRVGGYIERVEFEEGQEVRKGQVLFTLDARTYRAEFDRARAELERTRSRAALAASELARARKLLEASAISRELFEQRRAATSQAEADVQAAQAQVDVARLNLEFTQVRAPIDGLAGRALVTAGNLASPDTTVLATLVSLNPVHVYFEGDEQTYLRYARQAREDGRDGARGASNPVRVGLAGEEGYPHAGILDFLDNQVDPRTGTIRARAVLDNSERLFTPGLFARVQLVGNEPEQALLIDDKAVLTDQDRKYVYVLGEGDTAVRKDVVLGRMVDGLRIIESGLVAGDQVVVGGVQKIFFPGMPLDARHQDGVVGEATAVASAH
ncbi:efflux RND transporter periplasmic adaptor subunit [Arenimonas sp.]|uniref:efflux RND transporter periplasmic adaptor subunit n=1 Tax=Arenimonas sp. TaxID=1872635 RepID=UPI002E327DE2|nr:efflux RND transporter periplasmic adaptor subunit [Arenimonas sp.]HEX4853569.1 efflux RND transporter periplasmic adaptor subunit [Arenimonas sp.]